jgi:hypothetical protein
LSTCACGVARGEYACDGLKQVHLVQCQGSSWCWCRWTSRHGSGVQ